MDIWQTASPDRPVAHRLARPLAGRAGRDPLRAVSLEPVLPPLLAGATTAGAALPLRGLALPTGRSRPASTALGQAVRGGVAAAGLRGRARSPTCTARSTPFGKDVDAKAHSTTGKQGALAAQLDVVARCVEAGAPARVYSVSLGGFDTHADERGTQQRLLTEVDAGRLGVPHADGGHRARPRRGRDGLLGVRPPGGRQRQRGHRPRHRGPGVRRGRAGEGRVRAASSPASPTSTTATSSPPPTSATSTPPCCPTC